MKLINAYYADGGFSLVKGDVTVCGETVYLDGAPNPDGEILDCSHCTILPGFIDIHTHGGAGADASDGKRESLETLSEYYACHGVTSFCPTTMTLDEKKLTAAFRAAAQVVGKEKGAYMHGINMEGPYISFEKKGAQNGEYIRKPDFAEFLRLRSIYNIAIVDVAPEAEGAFDFSRKAACYCKVSAAHTASDGKTAQRAFLSGFSHATHLYNAMTGMKAREPGVIGAVLESDHVTAELICDGFHVDPAILRMTFKCLGNDRICVISDSLRSAGCPDGEYELGGQKVYVRQGKALLEDGTIAASVSNLHEEFLNLLDFGIDFSAALRACTVNPARVIGADAVTGSLKSGKRADITVLDANFDIKYVIVKGKVVYSK